MKARHRIIVTGHPYAYPHYFKVFEYTENPKMFAFVLPKLWRAKTEIKLEKRDQFLVYGLSVWSFGKKSLLGGAFKGWQPGMIYLLPYLKFKYNAKVLYSCSEPNLLTTLFNAILARMLGMRVIIFTWQNVIPENRLNGWKLKFSNFLVRTNIALSSGVICGNKKAEYIIKRLSPTAETFNCPLSGVDVNLFKPNQEDKTGLRDKFGLVDKKIILFYGALDERKGLAGLIQSFAMLARSDTALFIVGKGPLKAELQKRVDDFGLSSNVIFIDWLKNTELPALLAIADLFVYPSIPFGGWEEQFGYAMVEASASGIPVISTKTGSIEDVVINRRTGILTEPNNPKSLAEALAALIDNPEKRREMGFEGRQFAVNNFSHEIIAQKLSHYLSSFL